MDLRLNRTGAGRIFDKQLPVFNIFYPSQHDLEHGDVFTDGICAVQDNDFSQTKSVALYFHFPFCDTICNFCPFTRGKYTDHQIITDYLAALCKEVRSKNATGKLFTLPVSAIFVGGGTPSLLTAEEIRVFGQLVHQNFNLAGLREFSFECEVKSVTEDKVIALRDIGVTNARFGLQTFDPYWRDMFDLTASIEQIYAAAALFERHIRYTSFDILYGMNGQSPEMFERDLEKAVDVGNSLIDVYPLDNVVTQTRLHEKTKAAGHAPLTAEMRHEMNGMLRAFMRSRGFLPHNGHGYVQASKTECDRDPVVTRDYTFDYHNHVYGYHGFEVVGFGVNAISILKEKVLTNPNNRRSYIDQLMKNGQVSTQLSRHSREVDASRSLVTRLPYHGYVSRAEVDWDRMPAETLSALHQLYDAGLVEDCGPEILLTRQGWEWYVNLMYFMMPLSQRKILDGFIVHSLGQPGRELTTSQVVFS
ncbi:radical SAM protein [Aestuariivirga sp.]|uniref:radical SAM protein n=1 Tax=Aestuariivirga sp. TaxID=2650926 RepID=UPI0025B82EF6|nr:radical SAM protein [Aestuariivirga sp.]MCA3555978.1 radical SAM protein [Aestuariivirga sp.]